MLPLHPFSGDAAGSDRCRTANLAFGHGPAVQPQALGAEGSLSVKLTNNGTSTCVMNGFPRVDLRTDHGVVSVPHSEHGPRPVTLKPGGSAFFAVNHLSPVTADSGTEVSTVVVTPPNETHSHPVAWQGTAIAPRAATGSSYPDVDPVGPRRFGPCRAQASRDVFAAVRA